MAYTVYGSPNTRTLRVTWALEELGLDYRIVPARPHDAELTALNPSGKVPVLTNGETVIIDSAAICLYLADRHPKTDLSARPGTTARAQIDSWLHFAQTEFEAPLWTLTKHRFILPGDLRLDVQAWTEYEFGAALSAFEARLGDRPFAMGDHFTIPDIFLAQTGKWARLLRMQAASDTINAYLERVLGRPAFARARTREKEASRQ